MCPQEGPVAHVLCALIQFRLTLNDLSHVYRTSKIGWLCIPNSLRSISIMLNNQSLSPSRDLNTKLCLPTGLLMEFTNQQFLVVVSNFY